MLTGRYADHIINEETIGAAWYRRPATLTPNAPSWVTQLQLLANMSLTSETNANLSDRLNELQVHNEIIQLQKGL